MAPPLLETITASWGWRGLQPVGIVAQNKFCNVIVRAADGAFWRLCPEDLSCEVVARDDVEFQRLWNSDEFQFDWQMNRLAQIAEARLGPVEDDRCYCLKIPAPLGGAYDESNFGTISRQELLDSEKCGIWS